MAKRRKSCRKTNFFRKYSAQIIIGLIDTVAGGLLLYLLIRNI